MLIESIAVQRTGYMRQV